MTHDFRSLADKVCAQIRSEQNCWIGDFLKFSESIESALKQVYEQRPKISEEEIYGAIARAWCHDKNSHKVMDTDLAFAAGEEIIKLLANTKIKENE